MSALRWIFAVVVVTIALSVAIPVGYWSMADTSPALVEHADPGVYDAAGAPRELWRAGDTMYIRRHYCTTRQLPGTIHRSIVGVSTYPLSSSRSLAMDEPPGCRSIAVPVTIPPGLAPRGYRYHVEMVHYINPWIGEIRYPLRDVPFVVISNPALDEMTARYVQLDARLKHVESVLRIPPPVAGPRKAR